MGHIVWLLEGTSRLGATDGGDPWAEVVGAPTAGLLPCQARSTAWQLRRGLPLARPLTPAVPSDQLTVTVTASTRN